MNILYLCDEYPPGRHGGIGTAVQSLSRHMVRQGHNVVVAGFYDWGYGGQNEFYDEGVKVYRFRRALSSSFFKKQDSLPVRIAYKLLRITGVLQADVKNSLKKYGVFLEELISKYNIDIVEMGDYNDYARFCNSSVLFPKLSKPTLVKLHGSITYFDIEAGLAPRQNVFEIERDILKNSDGVVSVSNYTAEKTAKYLEYSKPIEVLYNGVDLSNMVNGAKKVDQKVVFTGSLAVKKGIYSLLEAWNTVVKELPEATLYICGKGPIEKLKECLSSKGALDSVTFMGHVDRKVLYQNLAEASVAVFPSYAETFGLGPVEAMASGTATIFSTRTSGPEILTDGKEGFLIDPDDIKSIADRIITLLKDRDLQHRIATAGREHVQQKFNIETIVEQHVAYYSSITNKTESI